MTLCCSSISHILFSCTCHTVGTTNEPLFDFRLLNLPCYSWEFSFLPSHVLIHILLSEYKNNSKFPQSKDKLPFRCRLLSTYHFRDRTKFWHSALLAPAPNHHASTLTPTEFQLQLIPAHQPASIYAGFDLACHWPPLWGRATIFRAFSLKETYFLSCQASCLLHSFHINYEPHQFPMVPSPPVHSCRWANNLTSW